MARFLRGDNVRTEVNVTDASGVPSAATTIQITMIPAGPLPARAVTSSDQTIHGRAGKKHCTSARIQVS